MIQEEIPLKSTKTDYVHKAAGLILICDGLLHFTNTVYYQFSNNLGLKLAHFPVIAWSIFIILLGSYILFKKDDEKLFTKEKIKSILLNGFVRGPLLFLGVTILFHVLTGGIFTIGTHALAFYEAIAYGLGLIGITILSFLLD